MTTTRFTALAMAFAAALAGLGGWGGEAKAQTPPPIPVQEQPEVLTRGPVHEAFAEPVTTQVQTGMVVQTQPPAGIQETAPVERPEGAAVVWVPGYWCWDADRSAYIWVSGCWRSAPPSMEWVPGYWHPVASGWQWVPGFWAPAGAKEIQYLPAPPSPDDALPAGPTPTPDSIWVPPCWYWANGQYIRRPGYWLTGQTGWVWISSHYLWTPRGYVFVEGHWDYPLQSRGVLFAPVYIAPAIHARVGFVFSPRIVIDLGVLSVDLFTYPAYCHYYFGDYYDDAYVRVGIYPWFEGHHNRAWYDPIYEYDRWHHRKVEPRWEERQRHDYDVRRSDRTQRPPQTYREMEKRVAAAPEPQRRNVEMARPLEKAAANRNGPTKFQPMNADSQRSTAKQTTEADKFREERSRWESKGSNVDAAPARDAKPDNAKPAPARDVKPDNVKPAPMREVKPDNVKPAPTREVKPDNVKPAPAREVKPDSVKPAPTREVRPDNVKPAPAREWNVTKAESVKVPPSPIQAPSVKPGSGDRQPPTRPADESQRSRGDWGNNSRSDRGSAPDSRSDRSDSGDIRSGRGGRGNR